MAKKWVMPAWMEPYRSMIVNTGGNSVEEFMNCDSKNCNLFTNGVRALLCTATTSQVALLEQLHKAGKLP
jgi:hypothetical protein